MLKFEWVRNVSGYRLERLEPDFLSFPYALGEDLPPNRGPSFPIVSPDAPGWVHDLVANDKSDGMEIRHTSLYRYEDMYLVPNGNDVEHYRPLDNYPAIFMEMAQLDESPDDALRFINKFGSPMSKSDTGIIFPRTIDLVLNLVEEIKNKVSIWEDFRLTGDASELVKIGTVGLSVGLQESQEQDRLLMELIPNDLISAIRFQFIQAVSGNQKFKQCEECSTWFEIVLGNLNHKNEKKFCSNACSMRAYRKRRKAKKHNG